MRLGAVAASLAVGLAACGGSGGSGGGSSSSTGSSSSASGAAVQGGTATFALPPSTTPNYIFPLASSSYFSVSNLSQFQFLLYRPLYFFGQGEKPVINYKLSVGQKPVFSNGGKTVTVTLNNYKWSDGQPVTARDVQFWQNLVTANKANWAAYVPGSYPDNVVSTKVVNAKTIQFTLDNAYSAQWFTYNELGQITPLPQHVMDIEAPGGPVGNYDMTPAGAKKVYTTLNTLAKSLSSYESAPWTTIDGPWKLQSLTGTGEATFVPNPAYTGPEKPHLAKFVELPFTSDTAEFSALQSGNSINVGYIPAQDIAQKNALSNYNFVPWIDFGINYFVANENNPTVGPILKQAYIRQVMEELIDQKAIIAKYEAGYGVQTCGPVPVAPSNPFADSYEKSCPYAFNPSKAIATLKSHGWNVVPGGTTTCTDPTKCGTGISKGAKLVFNYLYATGNTNFVSTVQTYKSDASKAGIVYNLQGQPFNNVIGTAVPCKSTDKTCTWEIGNWGGGWVFAPDYYPTGGELFSTGAGSNAANYSDPTNDANIKATHAAGGDAQAELNKYQDYLTNQVPFIWQPGADYSLSMIDKKLQGVTPQNAYLNLLPEEWYFTK